MNHPVVPFRIVLFSVLALAQGYLLFRVWRAAAASRRPRRAAGIALGSVLLVGLLYALNIYIVVRRLPWVDPPLWARLGLLYPVAIWNFGSACSAILLAALQGAAWVRRGVGLLARAGRGVAAAPHSVDLERRRLLRAGIGTVTAAPLLLSTYGAAAASMGTEVEEIRLAFGRRCRVVHLTDLHAGLYMTREDLRHYARLVSRLEPDILALTGDYISTSMSFLPCLAEMARVRTRHGIFVTLGNHEHWNGDPAQTIGFFEDLGMVVLDNAHRLVQTAGGPIAVAGIDDDAGHPDLDAALAGLDPAVPTILLSHRPEVFPRAAARGVNLTLAGHWHGGQIKLEALGASFSLAQLLTPYPEGLYQIDDARLYVSRGIGTTGPPIRLNAPPEVALFHLT